jgi:DnaJ family protein A protein 2
VKVKIDLVTALAGGSFTVKHLDGRILEGKIAAGEVIKPEEIRVIEGEGMPEKDRVYMKGHMFVHFDVLFPKTNWASQELIKKLEGILPAKSQMDLDGPEKEEVAMKKLEASHKNRNKQRQQSQYYEDEDEDDEHQHGNAGVNCGQQ